MGYAYCDINFALFRASLLPVRVTTLPDSFAQDMLSRALATSNDLGQIDLDINRTFRNTVYFRVRYGSRQRALFRILAAYSVYNTEIGYCQVGLYIPLYFGYLFSRTLRLIQYEMSCFVNSVHVNICFNFMRVTDFVLLDLIS